MNRSILSIVVIGILTCAVLVGDPGTSWAAPKGKWKIEGLTPRLLGKAEKEVCPTNVVLDHEYFGVLRNTEDRFVLLTNITNLGSRTMEDFREWQAHGGDEGLGGSQWVGMLVNEVPLEYPDLDKGEYMISFDPDGGLSFYNKREDIKAQIPAEEIEEIEGYHLSESEFQSLSDRESKPETREKMSQVELDRLQRYKLTSSIPRQTYFETPALEEGTEAEFFDFRLFVPIGNDLLWLCGQVKPETDNGSWMIIRE
jgi:hypothetical protein